MCVYDREKSLVWQGGGPKYLGEIQSAVGLGGHGQVYIHVNSNFSKQRLEMFDCLASKTAKRSERSTMVARHSNKRHQAVVWVQGLKMTVKPLSLNTCKYSCL